MDEQVRRLVWDGRLEADYRVRYYGRMASKLQRTENRFSLWVVILNSTAVVSLLSKLALTWKGADWLAGVLAICGAILGAMLTVHTFGKLAGSAASFQKLWSRIGNEYEALWAVVDDLSKEEILARWQKIEEMHYDADEKANATLPEDKKLESTAFHEMMVYMGQADEKAAA